MSLPNGGEDARFLTPVNVIEAQSEMLPAQPEAGKQQKHRAIADAHWRREIARRDDPIDFRRGDVARHRTALDQGPKRTSTKSWPSRSG